jgi:hypothetical protein
MHRNTKMATCCYCGARAVLVLGRDRHELACASCGAPLHALKQMPLDRGEAPRKAQAPGPKPAPRPATPPKPAKPPKRRKSLLRRLAEEVEDLIDDIFD